MIFVTDKGRMANNIFQYGQLYAWGREHGRNTMSMRFAYKYPDFRIAHTRYHNFMMYVMAKYAAKLHLIPTVDFDGEERGQIEAMKAHKHVLVTGWCVRFPDLFEKYKDEIVSLFEFDAPIRNHVAESMKQSEPGTVKLGIHIRRGDYRTWCGGRYFFDDDQYVDIIRQFVCLQQGRKVNVYICSNDPQLDITKFRHALDNVQVYYPQGNPAEDLCLLSECDYIAGPLSTFTLVASMYRNTPLYWMADISQPLSMDDFHAFDYQARHYDKYFMP